jgi:hypothetical protein
VFIPTKRDPSISACISLANEESDRFLSSVISVLPAADAIV